MGAQGVHAAGTTVGRMALTRSGPLPPGDRKHFSDPAADPVYAAIKSLDPASQHQIYELLRTKLVAEDVATYGTEKTRVGYALTALNHAARKLGHSPSVKEYRRLYREGMRESGWPDDRCIRRWLGAASWNDSLRRAHLEPKPDGDVVVFQHGHFYTVEEVASALRESAEDLGHPPTYPEYIAWVHRPDVRRRAGRRPASAGVFTRLCGGFLDALRVAGLLPGDPSHAIVSSVGVRRAEYRISDDSLKAGLCEVARRLGRSPRVAEYERERRLIHAETLANSKPRAIASYGTLNRRFGANGTRSSTGPGSNSSADGTPGAVTPTRRKDRAPPRTRSAAPCARRKGRRRPLHDHGLHALALNVLAPLPGWSYPTIKQAEYHGRRAPGSMTGPMLATKYGGWKRACKAAHGLKADGRTSCRSHHAWPNTLRGEPRVKAYTREEVIRAVRACGLELACRPSSSTYVRWSAAKRRLARVNNATAHVPTIGAAYRHFRPGGRERWRRVVEAAVLTDEELARGARQAAW